jgi:hypothetical protein
MGHQARTKGQQQLEGKISKQLKTASCDKKCPSAKLMAPVSVRQQFIKLAAVYRY